MARLGQRLASGLGSALQSLQTWWDRATGLPFHSGHLGGPVLDLSEHVSFCLVPHPSFSVECFVDVFEAMQMMCVNPGYQYKVFYLSILFRMSRGMSMKQGVIATFIQHLCFGNWCIVFFALLFLLAHVDVMILHAFSMILCRSRSAGLNPETKSSCSMTNERKTSSLHCG